MSTSAERPPQPATGWYCYDCGVVHPPEDRECPATHRPRPKGWRTDRHKAFGPVWKD